MAQTIATNGNTKNAKIAKIIQPANNQSKILLILLSKNKPKTTRNMIISPLIKKISSSFILVRVVPVASSAKIDFLGFLTVAND